MSRVGSESRAECRMPFAVGYLWVEAPVEYESIADLERWSEKVEP